MHTDEHKVRKLGAATVSASSSLMVKSVNMGTLVAKLSFFLFRVSDFSYLEDELTPIFIGLSSGVSGRILYVTFPHVLGHVSPFPFYHFIRIDRSVAENILF